MNRKEKMKITMDGLSQNEEFARVVTAVFASRLNPTVEELEDVKLAVSEAVTNAIIHGYPDGAGEVEVCAEAEITEAGERILTVTVHDTGIGIPDVEQAMEPAFTTAPKGERSGLGFLFMKAFMDHVAVDSKVGEGTTVTMTKQIGRQDK